MKSRRAREGSCSLSAKVTRMRDLNERRPSSITSRENCLKRSIPSSRITRSTASRIM
jgi:hypothetical protein